ncbi:MAG: hypothetical protein QXS69_04105 [Candidatus Aenigmatarchaeota archaeon]
MNIRTIWIKVKARKLLRENRVKKDFENDFRIHFSVKGDKDVHYVIYDKNKNEFSCDCKWFSIKKRECSHILACKMLMQIKLD